MFELPLAPERSASFTATRNACNTCTPLGACLVFRGIERAIPLLHGSQGCSTYIRRYLIGHFREPVDIASSNFSESAAVYGGGTVFRTGLENVIRQYAPALVGIATTCLSETIGDDVRLYLHEFRRATRDKPCRSWSTCPRPATAAPTPRASSPRSRRSWRRWPRVGRPGGT